MQATILLAEDDTSAAVPLIIGFQDQGFRALHAADGHQALELARVAQPDLILLDAMLPQMDGFAVCRTLRRASTVPIVLLTARRQEEERIRGLELGGDACLVKPLSFRELLDRVRAVLRRRGLNGSFGLPPKDRIVVSEIVLNHAACQAWREGRPVRLRRREFNLPCVLMQDAGQPVSRYGLLDHHSPLIMWISSASTSPSKRASGRLR